MLIWNRALERAETEDVYGGTWLELGYKTLPGRLALTLLTRPFFSKAYGALQDSRLSAAKVPGFIKKFKIAEGDFEGAPYRSFNDFFSRKLKPGKRVFTRVPAELPAFAEARYYGFERVREDQKIPIKGRGLSPLLALGGEKRAAPFVGGPVLVARLCPVDYHRYHYPDEGRTLEAYELGGPLHSVNPLALSYDGEILATNQRRVALLETKNFGLLAYVEVGALCVGKIVQTHDEQRPFERGQEKGTFLFGGSTVVLFGEPGAWKPDADLLERTANGMETLVRLGEPIGRALAAR
jgi:phosphatidylserine decarboxylase